MTHLFGKKEPTREEIERLTSEALRKLPVSKPILKEGEKIVEEIDRIVIKGDKITLLSLKERPIEVLRKDWRVFVDDIRQAQDEMSFGERRTLLLFDKGVGCQILTDKKQIFCGKRPEKVGYL